MRWTALGVLVLAVTASAQSPCERALLVPQGGVVFSFVPGQLPVQVANCGGLLPSLRTDLRGGWLARDLLAARLVWGMGSVVHSIPLPSLATDAVLLPCDRLAATVPQGSAGLLLIMDRSGATHCSVTLPCLPLRVAACERGVLLLVRDGAGRHLLELRNARNGTLLATRMLSGFLRDLAFNDDGEILVPDSRGAVEFLDQRTLCSLRQEAAPKGLVDVLSCGGSALCGLLEPAHVLWIRRACATSEQMPVGHPMSLEALPSGGALVREIGTGLAHRVDREGLSWFGWAPGGFGCGDGSGLRHGRGFSRQHDDDGDGFSTGVELREGTDAGNTNSRPLAILQLGPLLHLAAPGHGCNIFWIHADEGTTFPGFTLPTSAWVSATAGTLDPLGDGWLLLSQATGLPGQVRVSLFDPATGITLSTGAEEVHRW